MEDFNPKRATMQAMGFRRYGGPEVMEALEVEKPEPAPGEILIKVAAAGINPADSILRRGQLRLVVRLKLPFVPGSDVAGIVEAVGDEVTSFEPGDAVYAMLPTASGGAYAPYAAVAENNAALLPQGLSFAEAAGVPLAALTALQALRDRASLRSGAHVLINGASGGVGTFAVQMAKAMGARVTGASSGRNADLVKDLGADEVLDYTQTDVTAGEAGGARYDAIFDAAGVYPFRRLRRVLRPNSVAVTVSPAIGNPAAKLLSRFLGSGGRRLESLIVRPSGTDLEKISAWISTEQIRPVIDRSYHLAEAAEAQRYSETQRARGKIVLIVDEKLATSNVRTVTP